MIAPGNPYYDEWEEPREAVLLRDVIHLVIKSPTGDTYLSTPAGSLVTIRGRMTEDTRDMYGGRWLFSASIGALVEENVDFKFLEGRGNGS